MKLRFALAALLPGLPAMAQERPAITPSRDVSVTYRASGPGGNAGQNVEMRTAWLAARSLLRVDMPGGLGWMLVDQRAGTGVIIMEAQRMVMDLPAGQIPQSMMGVGSSARFTREGTARFANLDCTQWRVEDQGETGRVCLTSDGVMLRAEAISGQAAGRGTLEATAVAFGAQDPGRFQRPAGYQSFQMPGGLPRGNAIPPPGVTR